MKISENPYLFWKIERGLKKKIEVLWVKMAVLGEAKAEKTKRFAPDVRETGNLLKIVWDLTLLMQNTRFSWLIWLVSKSPKWVAKIPCARFWKCSLSLFHNWDFHLPVSREPLWVTSRLGFYSRSSHENDKNPEFLKFF